MSGPGNLVIFSIQEFLSASLLKLHNSSSLSGAGYHHQWEKVFSSQYFRSITVKIIYFSSAALVEHIKVVSQRDGIAYFSDAILNTVGLDTWHVAG